MINVDSTWTLELPDGFNLNTGMLKVEPRQKHDQCSFQVTDMLKGGEGFNL